MLQFYLSLVESCTWSFIGIDKTCTLLVPSGWVFGTMWSAHLSRLANWLAFPQFRLREVIPLTFNKASFKLENLESCMLAYNRCFLPLYTNQSRGSLVESCTWSFIAVDKTCILLVASGWAFGTSVSGRVLHTELSGAKE